ncbi:MAG TPA: YncE family protein [Acidobacteriaceae bacterium]|nr:YncE family protein [Acidobacteriaceae bacterium]
MLGTKAHTASEEKKAVCEPAGNDPAQQERRGGCAKVRRGLPALAAIGGAALLVTLLGGCKNRDFPDYPASYREFAYITNGGSNTVSVFDVANMRLDRQIQVGANPTGVTANPKRNEVYVVNAGDSAGNGSLTVIDAEKNTVAATIPLHKQPFLVDVDPAGDVAYVANSGSNTVSVIDLTARREMEAVPVGNGPGEARIAPDGKSLVVSNRLDNSVTVLGPNGGNHDWKVRATLNGCPGATAIAVMKDSSKAFVACSAGRQVMVVQLARAAEPGGPARQDAVEAKLDVGRMPVDVALKPDGGEVFVSNFESNTISEITTTTDDVSGAYIIGAHPSRGLVSNDNALLYVSNFDSQEVSVYSIDDGKRVGASAPGASNGLGGGAIHVGDGPDAMAFSANGKLLFVVDARSGDVAVVRTSDRSLFTLIPSGRKPNAIAVKAFTVHTK